MNQITLKSWIVGALILIGLSLIVDYYFIHVLFEEKQQLLRQNEISSGLSTMPPKEANFLATLQTCLPEIASQGIATPEALISYFQMSVGISAENIDPISQNETATSWTLKDGASVTIKHLDKKPVELSYSGHGKVLECVLFDCTCR